MDTQKAINIVRIFSSVDSFDDRAVAYQLGVKPIEKSPHSGNFLEFAMKNRELVRTVGVYSDPFGAIVISYLADSDEAKQKFVFDEGGGGWLLRKGAILNTAIRGKLEYLYKKARGNDPIHVTRGDFKEVTSKPANGRVDFSSLGVPAQFNVEFAKKISAKLTKNSVSSISFYPHRIRGTLRVDSYDSKSKAYRSFFLGEVR